MLYHHGKGLARVLAITSMLAGVGGAGAAPVMFVTQTPEGNDFTNIVAVFGNHQGIVQSAARGGDLWIQYDNGTRRNLTQEAGYGNDIAVRDPSIHWGGQKALFSMVTGGVTQNDYTPVFFQIYEVTGIGEGQTVQITKLPQDTAHNNVTPIYGTDDRILFTTDRSRTNSSRLYPQLDEYESAPTNTGIWRMKANGTGRELLDHSPSGDFTPIIDSFGRVIFTRWDHLQRDQQADSDIQEIVAGQDPTYGSRQYVSENTNTWRPIEPGDEIFPEFLFLHGPGDTADPTWDINIQSDENRNRFNQFFPWMMNEDGTEMETLNHVGRQELFSYIESSRTGLPEHFLNGPNIREGLLQLKEDPTTPGRYYGTTAPEFATHASGQIVALEAPPSRNADDMAIEYISHEDTRFPIDDNDTPNADQVGLSRDPMPRSDGTLWAAHSTSSYADDETINNPGSPAPYVLSSRYDYRIRKFENRGDGVFEPTDYLTTGITDDISYFDNYRYRNVEYNGPMWELQPVEVIARTRPTMRTATLPAIETNIIHAELGGQQGMDDLEQWLIENELALVVSRDVTVRADKQQDYRLKVYWSNHQTTDGAQPVKNIAWFQFLEGQQIRGYKTKEGRRVLAQPMGDLMNPAVDDAPPGSVKIGNDGSMAAFVPARRAMTWQTTKFNGQPSVRERYWLTFQPGEMRACNNCHGLNNDDVFGDPGPTNNPQALVDLMEWWKSGQQQQQSTGWVIYQ